MSKKYTNCPTCGGICYYPSQNFEHAKILISAEHEHIKSDLEYLTTSLARLEAAVICQKNLINLPSSVLLDLYFNTVRNEEIEKERKKQISFTTAQSAFDYDWSRAIKQQDKMLDELFKSQINYKENKE